MFGLPDYEVTITTMRFSIRNHYAAAVILWDLVNPLLEI